MRNATNLSIVFHTISSDFLLRVFTSGLYIAFFLLPPPTSFHFPRDLLTHVETSLFKRKKLDFLLYANSSSYNKAASSSSLFTYMTIAHFSYVLVFLLCICVDGNLWGGFSGGQRTRKMFYFSFDNKEEMFIRFFGKGREVNRSRIHYTITYIKALFVLHPLSLSPTSTPVHPHEHEKISPIQKIFSYQHKCLPILFCIYYNP